MKIYCREDLSEVIIARLYVTRYWDVWSKWVDRVVSVCMEMRSVYQLYDSSPTFRPNPCWGFSDTSIYMIFAKSQCLVFDRGIWASLYKVRIYPNRTIIMSDHLQTYRSTPLVSDIWIHNNIRGLWLSRCVYVLVWDVWVVCATWFWCRRGM